MSAWWDEDHKLLLLTQEEFDALPDGEVLTCIDDTTAIKGTDYIDDDTRGGCIPYGVVGNHPLRVAKLEAMAAKPKPPAFVAPPHKAWSCKIGFMGDCSVPSGADAPMRRAVAEAFREVIGVEADFNFSGWGAALDKYELEIVVGHEPDVKSPA